MIGVVVWAAVAAACTAPAASGSPATDARASSTAAASVTPASPSLDPSVLVVPARANIFGAGREQPPEPGGGGAGLPPVAVALPGGTNRVVAFPLVEGEVNPIIEMVGYNGPQGDGRGPTDIESYGGISGIVHQHNGMFLVGVFLTDAPPAEPAPERLDFTDGEDFELLEAVVGQTFLIGDGVGRSYRVPDDATRLFLGFADAAQYRGAPGYYGNNSGELQVRVEVAENGT